MDISLSPEILFYLGSLPVTNTLLWSFLIAFFIMFIVVLVKTRLRMVPRKLQGLVEVLIEGSYGFVKSVIGTDKKARRVYPLVMTMFLFILVSNMVVFIPGLAAISLNNEGGSVAIFRSVMSDYGMVFIMTMISILVTQIVAIIVHGPFGYIGKFINISGFVDFFKGAIRGKFKFGVLAQGFLDFFLGVMDIIGEIAKIISLSFRLFGNMFAGEVLSIVMIFLAMFIIPMPFQAIAIFIPLPFIFLGLLTAVVQAFVFSVLTLIFIGMASEINEDELAEKATI